MFSYMPENTLDIFESIKIGEQQTVSLFVWHDFSERDLVDLDSFIDDVFENMLSNSLTLGE
jgi:hypothetical protein